MTIPRMFVLALLLWIPGDAFEATSRRTTTTYICPIEPLETMNPIPMYYVWVIILCCILLLCAFMLSISICLLNIYFGRLHLESVRASQDEVEPLAHSMESLELLRPSPSPDVEPQQDEIQERPSSPIVLVHRAQEVSSEDEAAPGALVHRNITQRPLQPDSDQENQ